MEPLETTTGLDSAPDTGTEIESVLPVIPGAESTPPPTAAPEPQAAQPPPPPAPSWHDRQRQATEGWRQRQQAKTRELQERRAREAELTEARAEMDRRLEAQNKILQDTLAALRGKNGDQEEIPDPALDPAGFQKWLQTQQQSALQPILADIEARNQRIQEFEQQRALEAQQQEAQQQRQAAFQQYEREYQEIAPDVAYGSRERVSSVMELLTETYATSGYENPERYTLAFFNSIAAAAEANGDNPVAAIDRWCTAYAAQMGFVPVDPGDPLDWSEAAPPAPVQPPPRPAQEADRLAAVQRRAAAAGNAAPRVQGWTTPERSETRDLWNSGVTDMRQIQAAALRETKGNMRAAADLINSLG
jgi:hypothetical protein